MLFEASSVQLRRWGEGGLGQVRLGRKGETKEERASGVALRVGYREVTRMEPLYAIHETIRGIYLHSGLLAA